MKKIDCSLANVARLNEMSKRMRLFGLEMAKSTGNKGSHLGGSFSCIEILAVLYGSVMDFDLKDTNNIIRDRFYPSKNHCTLAHFPALHEAGFIPENELYEFQKDGGRLTGYPKNLDVGLEYSGGSLGMALSVAIGSALALKRKSIRPYYFVLMGDGELNEGSIWEAFMSLNQYKLDNVVTIIDRNHLSYDGDTEDVMALGDLELKFRSFGLNPISCDGHNINELLEAFNQIKIGEPNVIIADTVKGKGVSFIENNHEWHHKALTNEQYELARQEILGN